ncbi:PilZ domain-containing protein [Sulfurihydrogenibium sp.]|uniref:PilZ domain-containing protein n=1 Tax=Sulfurihydrogenibium sp. TaxID=2053621 RepID=UPI002611CD70|nr:PilZ domain-containing protein [Sulfurihydrogenibium sp.]
MEGTIGNFIEELAKKKKGEFYIFYEEVPIKVILNVLEIDFLKKQIEFEINSKIEAMVSQEKEIYAKYGNDILVLKALMWNKEVLITSFPTFAVEPKIKRNYVRVKCPSSKPVLLEIDSNICVSLRDISEKGFSFKLPKNVEINLEEEYDGRINISGKSYPLKFKILYKLERPDNTFRYGAKIIQAKPVLEDEIAKYVGDRQRELAKILNTFAD